LSAGSSSAEDGQPCQIRFDPGENVLAVQESLILAYAGKIRARG
jgi:hypothetical protein